MNSNHPTDKQLRAFVAGDLDDSIAMIVASHVDGCGVCQNKMQIIEAEMADHWVGSAVSNGAPDFSQMQSQILSLTPASEKTPKPSTTEVLRFKNKTVILPTVLRKATNRMGKWKSFGDISYSKIDIEGEHNLFFVHFEPGAKIPQHAHDANEYAYVVAGSFQDQHSEYITGDFASFGVDDTHHPYTEDPDGCLLLVSIEGPFVFQEGLGRLINPFRKLFFKKIL